MYIILLLSSIALYILKTIGIKSIDFQIILHYWIGSLIGAWLISWKLKKITINYGLQYQSAIQKLIRLGVFCGCLSFILIVLEIIYFCYIKITQLH